MPGPLREGDPSRLGDYALEARLGDGGQGLVFLGRGPSGERVAVKLLRHELADDEDARARFVREVASAKQVARFCTAQVLDAAVAGDQLYIVSEFVDGPSLQRLVASEGPRRGGALDRLAMGTATALAAIHQAGIVHRDFKPANVLLGPDGPRVIDFGISRALDSGATVMSLVVGTPAYMAPEQLGGQPVGPAADVFSWAATMVFAATGRPPFGADTIPAVIGRVLYEPPDLTGMKGHLRTLVGECLAKDSGDRPDVQQVLLRLLDSAQTGDADERASREVLEGDFSAVPAPLPEVRIDELSHAALRTSVSRSGRKGPVTPVAPPSEGEDAEDTEPRAGGNVPPADRTRSSPAEPRSSGSKRLRRALVAGGAFVALLAAVAIAVPIATRELDAEPKRSQSRKPGADFNAAISGVVSPANTGTGTMRFQHAADFDSLDPGNMSRTHALNFARLYSRALVTYKPVPGADGTRLTGDLAEGPGKASADGKKWTYTLRRGLKYADGTKVTAGDVKYAVARSAFGREVLGQAPTQLTDVLDAGPYAGPYRDGDLGNFRGVETPDDRTVIFRLKRPFAEFDYLAASPQTVPVPKEKDTRDRYGQRPMATGPYQIERYVPGESVSLTPNSHWDQATDPNRKRLASRIKVRLALGPDAIDGALLSGQSDLHVQGLGLRQVEREQVLSDPTRKKHADDVLGNSLKHLAINTKMAPFSDVNCRKAIQYAVDRSAIRQAYGGRYAEIARTLLPPDVPGHQRGADVYARPGDRAEVRKARQSLASCSQPQGFTTIMAVRRDYPDEVAAAHVIRQNLAKIGITVTVREFPAVGYTTSAVGAPGFLAANRIGLVIGIAFPDFPTGYGVLSPIADGRSIQARRNRNISQLDSTEINRLFDQAAGETDPGRRAELYGRLDSKIMETAAVLPLVHQRALLYRGPRLTNVYFSQSYGMYDYANLGVRSP